MARVIQLFAASVFWIVTIAGIPRIIDMNNIGLINGVFWVPQVTGGTGFIICCMVISRRNDVIYSNLTKKLVHSIEMSKLYLEQDLIR